MLVLSWIIKSVSKKNNPPQDSQPWDKARRRQGEVSPPQEPFPKLQDLGKGIREILLELEGEFSPKETVSEGKKAYQIESMPEAIVTEPIYEAPQAKEDIRYQDAVTSREEHKNYREKSWLSQQAVVQGIIMSEILQPPRAKRPFRH